MPRSIRASCIAKFHRLKHLFDEAGPMSTCLAPTRLVYAAAALTCALGALTSQAQEGGPRRLARLPAPVVHLARGSGSTQPEALPYGQLESRELRAAAYQQRLPAAAGVFPFPEYLQDDAAAALAGKPSQTMPEGFVPWWRVPVMSRLSEGGTFRHVSLEELVINALAFSSHVRAISDDVLIQETSILVAEANFDWRAFMDSKFVRTSDPVGNLLETGGPPRLREADWGYSAGIRRRTTLGGSWEMSQRIGTEDSNSRFFVPKQQGNARLSISFNQPLLNGAGRAYNTSLILLADIDTNVAMDRTVQLLQDHLLRLTESYWELYLQRSILLQRRRHLQRAQVVLEELLRRREVDALESQILRAQAAVAAREAELVRTAASIRNSQARIRALTNSPMFLQDPYAELVPLDHPSFVPIDVSLSDALVTALQYRPEMDAASQEIRAAGVRLDMSRNELLPALDLVLETYVAGLRGDVDIGRAYADQFSVGEPSYTAGLVFEVPLGRRAALAKMRRRQLELRQVTQQFEEELQTLLSEVEVRVREVGATFGEMSGKFRAMQAAAADVEYATKRWEVLPGDDRSASFLLEDLLDAQDRLALEEFGFATAQRDYAVSLTALNRATGTLLQQEQIEPVRACEGGLPFLQFEKSQGILPTPEELPPAIPAPRR